MFKKKKILLRLSSFLFSAQIQDVLRLKEETQSVKTIIHRLSSR